MLKTLEEVSEFLGINADKLSGSQKDKEIFIAWTNDLIAKNGLEWAKRNRIRLLNRWEMLYGISDETDSEKS